jgi:hypothetical protein
MAKEIKKVSVKVVTLLKEIAASDKCPPQQRLIVETLKGAGGKLDKSELIALLSRPVEEGGLKTNQTPDRIYGFYRPKLVAAGTISETSEDRETEVEVEDKPAVAEKPAKEKKEKKSKSVKGEVGEKKTEEVAA